MFSLVLFSLRLIGIVFTLFEILQYSNETKKDNQLVAKTVKLRRKTNKQTEGPFSGCKL